jgi:hypothetical protein
MACHGRDYRGTVLSRAHAARHLATEFGTKDLWRGFQVGCYACHDGPGSERASRNRPPVANPASVSTAAETVLTTTLRATDPDFNSLVLRVVSRPAHGRAGINGTTATYVPDSGFTGTDSFTFAAWDGSTDSNLATVSIAVATSAPAVHVTVSKSGSGSGAVTSTPPAINCGATCTAAVPEGSSITLFAQADHDSRFEGWSGPCVGTGPCQFAASVDTTVAALFTYVPTKYALTVTAGGTGRGVVKSTPEAIECPGKCSATFGLGTNVTLTATSESNSTFAGWSGACTGADPCVVSMTQQRNVTATFNAATGTRWRSVRR